MGYWAKLFVELPERGSLGKLDPGRLCGCLHGLRFAELTSLARRDSAETRGTGIADTGRRCLEERRRPTPLRSSGPDLQAVLPVQASSRHLHHSFGELAGEEEDVLFVFEVTLGELLFDALQCAEAT